MGKWAFIVGLVIAVLAAFLGDMTWIYWLLPILGVVVGFLNITEAESRAFLIAGIALLLSASSVQSLPLGVVLARIMGNLLVFIAPAVVVVALKSLLETARV